MRTVISVLGGAVLGLFVGASPASAALLPVSNTDDMGTGSLRQAMTDSNLNGSAETDQIPINTTGVINLQSQLPNLFTPVTITGPGPASLTVRRQSGDYPIFDLVAVNAGDVLRVQGLKVADSSLGITAGTGAGQIVLENLWVTGNVNTAGPAGIVAGGAVMSISNSTISTNQGTNGGGIHAYGGASVGIVNTTIAGNTAKSNGGGIYIEGTSDIAISSSTIAGNTADSDNNAVGDGGGAYNNASGGAPFGSFRIANTLLADNRIGTTTPVPNQCFGTTYPFTSYGYNLRTTADPNCQGIGGSKDLLNPNALIGSLADNGGPTLTIALLPGSPAINGGYSTPVLPFVAPCPATDQRGLPRTGLAGPCDIGAFEFQPPPPPESTAPEKKKCKKLKRKGKRKGKRRLKCRKKRKRKKNR
jgi:parallel beta-helix repeat protein